MRERGRKGRGVARTGAGRRAGGGAEEPQKGPTRAPERLQQSPADPRRQMGVPPGKFDILRGANMILALRGAKVWAPSNFRMYRTEQGIQTFARPDAGQAKVWAPLILTNVCRKKGYPNF